MQTTNYIRTITIQDLDTKQNIFKIELYNTNENNIRGYIAKTLHGSEFCRKFYMDYKSIIEVTAAFRKHIRDNKINLNRF
jgi:hypothetical protein